MEGGLGGEEGYKKMGVQGFLMATSGDTPRMARSDLVQLSNYRRYFCAKEANLRRLTANCFRDGQRTQLNLLRRLFGARRSKWIELVTILQLNRKRAIAGATYDRAVSNGTRIRALLTARTDIGEQSVRIVGKDHLAGDFDRMVQDNERFELEGTDIILHWSAQFNRAVERLRLDHMPIFSDDELHVHGSIRSGNVGHGGPLD
jgi:hypothetical protein